MIEHTVYLVPLPGDIKAAVQIDIDGYPSIYINDALSPQAKKKAFWHEIRHIAHNDFFNDKPIREIEDNAG